MNPGTSGLESKAVHDVSGSSEARQAKAAETKGKHGNKFDSPEPFSGVATGAAFGGAFGAGLGALYDAHHNRKVIEEIEARAEHNKPNDPQNYGNATADMTDLSSS